MGKKKYVKKYQAYINPSGQNLCTRSISYYPPARRHLKKVRGGLLGPSPSFTPSHCRTQHNYPTNENDILFRIQYLRLYCAKNLHITPRFGDKSTLYAHLRFAETAWGIILIRKKKKDENVIKFCSSGFCSEVATFLANAPLFPTNEYCNDDNK